MRGVTQRLKSKAACRPWAPNGAAPPTEGELSHSQIQRFLVLHKELDADDGELTRTQKVRRSFIAERYAPLVKGLYDGSSVADIATEVTFEDGRKGTISGRVKISDLEPHAAGGKGGARAA